MKLTKQDKAELDDLVAQAIDTIFEKMDLEDEEHERAILEHILSQVELHGTHLHLYSKERHIGG